MFHAVKVKKSKVDVILGSRDSTSLTCRPKTDESCYNGFYMYGQEESVGKNTTTLSGCTT